VSKAPGAFTTPPTAGPARSHSVGWLASPPMRPQALGARVSLLVHSACRGIRPIGRLSSPEKSRMGPRDCENSQLGASLQNMSLRNGYVRWRTRPALQAVWLCECDLLCHANRVLRCEDDEQDAH